MIKHRLMAVMISAGMGASMLISPVTTLAADETPVTEDVQDASAEETPAEAESAPEEQKEAAPAEEVQDAAGETPAAEDIEPAEEKTEAAEGITEETDESAPAGAVEEAPAAEKAKAEPAVEVFEEEIKETSVDGLLGVWEGEGFYTWGNPKTGKVEGIKYLYSSTNWHKGFKTINGYQYYFDKKSGYLKTGWFTVNGYQYYGNTASTIAQGRGVLYTGLKVIGGHHYYFFGSTRDGHYGKTLAKNTWVTTGGQKFYAGKDGKLICGFKTIGGKGYYFYPSGTSSHKYGQMAREWFTYNGFRYHAASSGVLDTGFKTIDGIHYYFYPKTSGNHYAKTMAKGWFWANGFKYYADSYGELVTGWRTINGVKYYFWPKTANGHYSRTMARNGTFKIGDTTYKFDSNGKSTVKKLYNVPAGFTKGYVFGEYSRFNSHARDNGLGGTMLWINCTYKNVNAIDLSEEGVDAKVYLAQATDQNGNKWLLQIDMDYFTKIDKYQKLANHSLCITGEYQGYSDTYKMPAIFVEKIFDQDTGNTIIPDMFSYKE